MLKERKKERKKESEMLRERKKRKLKKMNERKEEIKGNERKRRLIYFYSFLSLLNSDTVPVSRSCDVSHKK